MQGEDVFEENKAKFLFSGGRWDTSSVCLLCSSPE